MCVCVFVCVWNTFLVWDSTSKRAGELLGNSRALQPALLPSRRQAHLFEATIHLHTLTSGTAVYSTTIAIGLIRADARLRVSRIRLPWSTAYDDTLRAR